VWRAFVARATRARARARPRVARASSAHLIAEQNSSKSSAPDRSTSMLTKCCFRFVAPRTPRLASPRRRLATALETVSLDILGSRATAVVYLLRGVTMSHQLASTPASLLRTRSA